MNGLCTAVFWYRGNRGAGGHGDGNAGHGDRCSTARGSGDEAAGGKQTRGHCKREGRQATWRDVNGGRSALKWLRTDDVRGPCVFSSFQMDRLRQLVFPVLRTGGGGTTTTSTQQQQQQQQAPSASSASSASATTANIEPITGGPAPLAVDPSMPLAVDPSMPLAVDPSMPLAVDHAMAGPAVPAPVQPPVPPPQPAQPAQPAQQHNQFVLPPGLVVGGVLLAMVLMHGLAKPGPSSEYERLLDVEMLRLERRRKNLTIGPLRSYFDSVKAKTSPSISEALLKNIAAESDLLLPPRTVQYCQLSTKKGPWWKWLLGLGSGGGGGDSGNIWSSLFGLGNAPGTYKAFETCCLEEFDAAVAARLKAFSQTKQIKSGFPVREIIC